MGGMCLAVWLGGWRINKVKVNAIQNCIHSSGLELLGNWKILMTPAIVSSSVPCHATVALLHSMAYLNTYRVL